MKRNNDIAGLSTESANEASKQIDVLSALEIVKMINEQDKTIALAVEKALPEIARAAEEIAKRFNEGGRIIYVGAGSSGRTGVMDAVELLPTYGVGTTRAFGILAGGLDAMFAAVEGAEDQSDLGASDIEAKAVNAHDVVIGIAASGRTPYTIGALEKAKDFGAFTVAIVNNEKSKMAEISDCAIEVVVGPEVVSGSTRMKAGTSQKMVVNMLSTTAMILVGKVYENYMVYVQSTNQKLVARSINMISSITGLSLEAAETLFNNANQSVAGAVVMEFGDCLYDEAVDALNHVNGNVREAVKYLKGDQ